VDGEVKCSEVLKTVKDKYGNTNNIVDNRVKKSTKHRNDNLTHRNYSQQFIAMNEQDMKRTKVPELLDSIRDSWVSQQADKPRAFELPNKTRLKEYSEFVAYQDDETSIPSHVQIERVNFSMLNKNTRIVSMTSRVRLKYVNTFY
jgi:hypothetical protein